MTAAVSNDKRRSDRARVWALLACRSGVERGRARSRVDRAETHRQGTGDCGTIRSRVHLWGQSRRRTEDFVACHAARAMLPWRMSSQRAQRGFGDDLSSVEDIRGARARAACSVGNARKASLRPRVHL